MPSLPPLPTPLTMLLKTLLANSVLSLSACGFMTQHQPKEVTEADNNSTVTIEKDQPLVIHLVGNYSTGTQWIPCPAINPNYVFKGPTFSQTEERLGGTTLVTFTTSFHKAEPTDICLSYQRSWEKEVQKTFKLTVKFK